MILSEMKTQTEKEIEKHRELMNIMKHIRNRSRQSYPLSTPDIPPHILKTEEEYKTKREMLDKEIQSLMKEINRVKKERGRMINLNSNIQATTDNLKREFEQERKNYLQRTKKQRQKIEESKERVGALVTEIEYLQNALSRLQGLILRMKLKESGEKSNLVRHYVREGRRE